MSEIEKVCAELLAKEFGLNQAMVAAEFEQRLQERLVYLMLNDMEGLLQLLYRIDVNEQKVKVVFALGSAQNIAPALAKLIIDRMWQKAETRLRYR